MLAGGDCPEPRLTLRCLRLLKYAANNSAVIQNNVIISIVERLPYWLRVALRMSEFIDSLRASGSSLCSCEFSENVFGCSGVSRAGFLDRVE